MYNTPCPIVGIGNMIFNSKQEILLGERISKKIDYYNCWAFPGGHVEKNESYTQASLRETKEECGLVGLTNTRLYAVLQNTGIDRVHTAFLTTSDLIDDDEIPVLNEPENFRQWRWFSIQDAQRLHLYLPTLVCIFMWTNRPLPHGWNAYKIRSEYR